MKPYFMACIRKFIEYWTYLWRNMHIVSSLAGIEQKEGTWVDFHWVFLTILLNKLLIKGFLQAAFGG